MNKKITSMKMCVKGGGEHHNDTYKKRQSGIELIKILAILLIVFSHLTQTLGSIPSSYNYTTEYWINFAVASTNLQTIALALFQHCGSAGNLIFLIASSWFLCSKTNLKSTKITTMILNVWTISVLILFFFLIFGANVTTKNIIKCFFPNFLCTNWFITCYILLYISHPLLNTILCAYNKKQLFIIVSIMFGLYYVLGYLSPNKLFFSPLILFYTVYLTVAYIRFYLKEIVLYKKVSILLIVIGILGIVIPCLAMEILGQYYNFFSDKVLHWCNNQNIFIFLFALGLFGYANNLKFHSNFVNKLSSLSLLVYIIHENLLVREYLRPYLYDYIYSNYNHAYNFILLVMLSLSLLFFVLSNIFAFIYSITIQKAVIYIANKATLKIKECIMQFIDRFDDNEKSNQP